MAAEGRGRRRVLGGGLALLAFVGIAAWLAGGPGAPVPALGEGARDAAGREPGETATRVAQPVSLPESSGPTELGRAAPGGETRSDAGPATGAATGERGAAPGSTATDPHQPRPTTAVAARWDPPGVGRVIDEDGHPIAGVMVLQTSPWPDPTGRERRTPGPFESDAEGRYVLPLDQGALRLSIGRAPEPWTTAWDNASWHWAPDGAPAPRICLVRGGWVTARVFVPNAREKLTVSLTVMGGTGRSYRSTVDVVPGAVVRVGPYAPGRVEVKGEVAGHGVIRMRAIVIEAGRDTDLGTVTVAEGGAVTLRLLGPAGAHPGPCTVVCVLAGRPGHGDFLGRASLTAEDPADRVLEIVGLVAGTYVLRVASEAHADAVLEVPVTEGQTTHVELALGPVAHLPVRLVDADGKPLDATVVRSSEFRRVWGDWDDWDPARSAAGRLLDLHGRVGDGRLRGAPGRWTLEGWDAAVRAWRPLGTVDVTAGENPPATFRWPPE